MRTIFFQAGFAVNFQFISKLASALAFIFSFAIVAEAQTVQWTTNYYAVTGADFREIRRSMERARPWKEPFDGDTRWTITWRFNFTENAAGCALSSFSTTTQITTTMPRWTPPTNVMPEVKERWTRYYTNLLAHETGHARFALAAAAEIRKRIGETPAQASCDQLKHLINERAGKVMDDYRAREKEYDRRTDHGRNTDGPR
jgi:predicted secreted Zn-dependent protease